MTDYKILQNIDLAQNEIKEVSKIANDRQDGKDKGLLIQTRDNTSLTFKRKIGGKENFIEGKVIDGTGEEVKKSILNIKPSEVSISNEKGATNSTKSKLVLGLNSETKEHIEAISPLVDIKTGNEGYTDPHISLKKDKSILELQSKTVEIKSKGTTESSLTMDGSITGVSNDILLKDSNKNVSLNLKADGTITESANTSIKETVDKVSVALVKDTTQSITLKNEKETTPSQIEILEPNVKVSKGSNSYVNLTSSGIEEKGNNITIKTPNNVTLTLDETGNSASLDSKGTIILTSNKGATGKEASTSYGANEIVSTADTLKLHTQGYTGSESTKSYPHVELISDDNGKSILMEGNTIDISSKGDSNSVSITGSELGINNTNTTIESNNNVSISGTKNIIETSENIMLKDTSDNVSLNLNTDGTIRESANTSITEKVGTHTVSLNTSAITIEDSTTSATPSKIIVNNKGVYASKGGSSYVNIESGEIEEKSNTVTVKTPNVVFNLEESNKSASLKSESGTITLTSQNGAETIYENNTITTKADTIIIKSKGYVEKDATNATKYYPHIELKSSDNENSALIESKTINIYSKDSGSNTEDTINVSGSTVNITGTTTNIKTDTLNIKSNSDKGILTLNTNTPKVIIPSWTETDINSQTIGLGDSDSETIVSGSKFTVNTGTTNITSTTTVSGTTTLKSSSSSPKNTLVVNGDSTSITGTQADINPGTVNIGTATTTAINVGRREGGTTALKSKTTNITSPTLEVKSGDVNFNGTNQTVTFEGTSGSSLISKVPTDIKNTTFSVKREDSTKVEVFKVDTSKASPLTTTIKGTEANINPTTVNIGTDTTGDTNNIYIGKNSGDTTTLQSNTTNITSPMIGIGTKPSSDYPLSIGKNNSFISLLGNNDLSITANNTNSEVQARDLKFTNSLYGDNIKIYWDSKLQSLVFARG